MVIKKIYIDLSKINETTGRFPRNINFYIMQYVNLVFNIRLKDQNAKDASFELVKAGLRPFFKTPKDQRTPKLMVEVAANSEELKKAKEFLMNPEFNRSIK